MRLLTAVLAFILSLPITMILLYIVRYIMDEVVFQITATPGIELYYPDVVNVFFMVLTFVAIFSIVALGLNAMGIGEKFSIGGHYD